MSGAKSEKIRRQSMGVAGLVDESTDPLQTVLRIRPTRDIDDFDDQYIEIKPETEQIVFKHPIERGGEAELFKFDAVFGPEVQQKEIYNSTVEALIEASFQGKNACLFTYGASGSGKTHTMMGSGQGENAGVLPRAMQTVFEYIGNRIHDEEEMFPFGSCFVRKATTSEQKAQGKIQKELKALMEDITLKRKGEKRNSLLAVPEEFLRSGLPTPSLPETFEDNDDGVSYVAFASFYELYNEKVYDLLEAPDKKGKRKELSVKQDKRGAFVDKIRHIKINSAQDAFKILDAGRRNLSVGQTRLNKDSSRSHCLFTIRICKQISPGAWQVSSLVFCDLAGAERVKKIGLASTKRLAESKTINQSLMQLRIVISDLQAMQKVKGKTNVAVMFRNSKLTRLMQSFLVGHSKTSIIIAVSNDPKQFEETQNSLKFASNAQSIQLGKDRHGKSIKDTDKLNITYTPLDKTAEVPEDDFNSSNEDPAYQEFSREELIADLNYYREREISLKGVVHEMKNEWKKDEGKWLKKEMFFKGEMEDLRIDLQNSKIMALNAQQEYAAEYFDKLGKKNAEIKELRNQLKAGEADKTERQSLANQLETALTENANLKERQAELQPIPSCHSTVFDDTLNCMQTPSKKCVNSAHKMLQFELDEVKLRRDDLSDQVEKLSKQISQGKAYVQKLNEDTDSLKIQLSETKGLLKSLHSDAEELKAAKNDLEDNLAQVTQAKFDLETKLTTVNQLNMENTDVEKNFEQVNHLKNDLESKLTVVQANLIQLTQEKSDLEKVVDEVTRNKMNLEVNLSDQKRQTIEIKNLLQMKSDLVTELRNEVATLAADNQTDEIVDQLRSERGELEQQCASYLIELDTFTRKIAALESEKSVAENRLENLQTELLEKESIEDDTLEKMRSERAELEGRCASYLTHLDEFAKKLEKLESQKDATEKELVKINRDLKDANAVIADLLSKTLAHADEISNLEIQLAKAESEIAIKQQKESELTDSFETNLADRRKSKAAIVEVKEKEIASLSEQIQALQIAYSTVKPEPSTADGELKSKIAELEAEIKDKDIKYEKSMLRKQRDKAKRENEEMRKKVQEYEDKFFELEKELQNAPSKENVAPEKKKVKEEFDGSSVLEEVTENRSKVKPEPDDVWESPAEPAIPKKDLKAAKRSRKLNRSQSPLAGTPKPTRKLRQRK